MNETLLATHALANGTTLTVYDASRRQAADRWIVVLEARLEIPLDEAVLSPLDPEGPTLAAVRSVLETPLVCITRKERVFVDESDKDGLLEAFLDDYRRTALPHLAHPAFPAFYMLKQYQEACRRRALREAAADLYVS